MSSYTIPNVIAQHPRGERIMDVYSHLLTERIVYLGTPVDSGVANALIAQLLHLEADSTEQEINLYINCEGGDLPPMLAVYDTMQYIQSSVATTCVGQAIGVGAVLLAAGTAGRRAVLPHARVVLHQPAARGQGPIPDLILQADELVRMRADIEAILSRHTGQSVQTLRADTDRDRVFTARTALDYGIVDHILGQRLAEGQPYAARASMTGPDLSVTAMPCWRRKSPATCSVSPVSVVPSAPARAAIISLDGSFRPRSISDRYCGDRPARPAVSARVSFRRRRRARIR
jgi:ATP-dependent Clp protease protease subunit